MFTSHSRKSFRSLLLLAVLSLCGLTARAQVSEWRGAETAALPHDSFHVIGWQWDTHRGGVSFTAPILRPDGTQAVALRDGFKFESPESVARFGMAAPPPREKKLVIVNLEDLHKASWGQDPQDPQTSSAPPKPVPLTPGEKMERAFRRAFLSPMPYASAAFSATITQIGEDDLPHKTTGDKVADGLTRMAINFGRSATRTVFAGGVYASLFKQDPRYDRSQGKGIGGKVLHAVSRVFVTRDDDWNIEPNYSRFAGVFTASALSNAWERSTPGHDRIGWDATFRRFGKSFINDAINNILFRELLPDIF